MGCILLLAASALGIIVMIVSVRMFGGPAGFAISTFVDMLLLGGWLLYLWVSERRQDRRDREALEDE